MNSDQLNGQIRTFLAAAGGATIGAWLVAKGYVSQEGAQQILQAVAGAVATIIVAIWSQKSNSTAAMAQSVSEKKSEGVVGVVMATKEAAAAIPSANVVAAGTKEAQAMSEGAHT